MGAPVGTGVIQPGHVRIPGNRLEVWTPLLAKIYRAESLVVGRPGSSRRDINECLWTLDELRQRAGIQPGSPEDSELSDLLAYLLGQRQALSIQRPNGAEPRFITRVAETVRLLGHTYEYWWRGRSGVDAVRWLIECKPVPGRTVTVGDFETRLNLGVGGHLKTAIDSKIVSAAVSVVVPAVASFLSPDGKSEHGRFSEFQLRSTIEMLRAQYDPNYPTPAQILTAGVGAGKTAAFLVPVLVSALAARSGPSPRPRTHLLVYPRLALARDQSQRLKELRKKLPSSISIHFDHASEYPGSVLKGIEAAYGMGAPQHDVILITLETLKRRLQHPRFVERIRGGLVQRVVLDEIHLAEGVQGAHVALLMSRLKALVASPGQRVLWTASSATVAVPQDHASRIFGLRPREIQVIRPEPDEAAVDGLAHHIFLRPSGVISNLGLLVNATSLLVHARRDRIGDGRPTKKTSGDMRPKTIGFADSLDLLGRWNADLRENERTEQSRDRPHAMLPSTPPPSPSWTPRQRELPYALRFQRPMERRIETDGGQGVGPHDALTAVLAEHRGESVCSRCQAGERISLGNATRDTLREMEKLVYRSPFDTSDAVKGMRIRNPVFDSPGEIGTLDLCPYLRAGACLWFPRDRTGGTDAVETIPHTTPVRYEWKDVARSTIYSAKRGMDDVASGEDLASIVFWDNARRVFDVGSDSQKVPVDIVLASPSLEVGVDLKMLTESIMTRAIRNVATYRQKAGRVGRDSGLDALNVTLVTDNPIDLHYYRQPAKLVTLGRLDPIPLKDRNEAVIRSALYSAVWDWLALKGLAPEVIPPGLAHGLNTHFFRALGLCKGAVVRERVKVREHLSAVSRSRYPPSDPVVEAAIRQVEAEIDFLLLDATNTLWIPGKAGSWSLADAMVHRRDQSADVQSRADPMALKKLNEAVGQFQGSREQIPAERLDLAPVLRDLDRMRDTEIWVPDKVEATVQNLHTWLTEHPSDPLKSDVEGLANWVLAHILEATRALESKGVDLRVLRAYSQFRVLHDSEPQKTYYLSYLLQALPAFGNVREPENRWFVRPENLYTNPYEPTVEVSGYDAGPLAPVSVREALFGFIPGTWTYRLPNGCYKVKAGPVEHITGGRLIVRLDQLAKSSGSRFVRLSAPVPNPLIPGGSVSVYEPRRIEVQRAYGKYVNLDLATNRVLDKDEATSSGSVDGSPSPGSIRVKIPRSFLSQWLHVALEDAGIDAGVTVPTEPGDGLLRVEPEKQDHAAKDATLQAVRHPLFAAAFDSVAWHDRLRVTEYVLSDSRSYSTTGGAGVDVSFRDELDQYVGLGTQYESEGLSFGLKPGPIEAALESMVAEMQNKSPIWTASVLRAFKAHLYDATRNAGTPLGTFAVNDAVALTLQTLWPPVEPPSFESLVSSLQSLASDSERLRKLAEGYVRRKRGLLADDEESVGGATMTEDDAVVSESTSRLVQTMEHAAQAASTDPMFLRHWGRRAFLTTFGVTLLTGLQKFAGSTEDEVGYSVAAESYTSGNPAVIYLFDRSAFGNGSAEVANRFFHLPHILRHGETEWSKMLPSDDFLGAVEEELLQCQQFHTDASALTMLDPARADGIVGLRDVTDQAREVRHVAGDVWSKLGVHGPSGAWRLAIAREIVGYLSEVVHAERDDLIRATTICWNGCPECIFRPEAATGGLEGQTYLDKAVLDRWFEKAREGIEEYRTFDLDQLVAGSSALPFGHRQRLVLDRPSRLTRSISLPWTLGFEIKREAALPQLRLLARTSDIRNLAAGAAGPGGHGFNSLGLKRLVWFNLLGSCYLDILGKLPAPRKWIDLVYYDMTDLSFDDVGLSPRMLASVSAVAAADHAPVDLQRLSDILEWLLRRGFRIRICVDAGRAKEPRVSELLGRLRAVGATNLEVLVKSATAGSLHAKALISPVGALSGSSNLTIHGAGMNEEMVHWSVYGTREYEEVRDNARDLFHGATPWNP